jgi:hypothetical protein
MAKKKKKHKSKKHTTNSGQNAQKSKRGFNFHRLVVIAVGFLVFVAAYALYQSIEPMPPTPERPEVKNENFVLRENRPPLSPQGFSGTVRTAYQIANQLPAVLDQLYCYCRCKKNFGHKNLQSCFVDTHAST